MLSLNVVALAEFLSLRLVMFLDLNLWVRLKVMYDRTRSTLAQRFFLELLDLSAHVPRKVKMFARAALRNRSLTSI